MPNDNPTPLFKNAVLVFFGGGLGSTLRYFLNQHYQKFDGFPFNTFMANILGCFTLAVVLGFSFEQVKEDEPWQLMLGTGICGGFTTFSAFTIENLRMLQQGRYMYVAIYIAMSITVGLLSAYLGYRFVKF